MSLSESLFIFFLSLLISLVSVPLWILVAQWINLVDRPAPEKIHRQPVPTGGGAVLVMVFFVILWAVFLFQGDAFPMKINSLIGLTLAGLLMFCVGIYDDMKGCSVQAKFFFQIMAAAIICSFGLNIEMLTNPFGDSFSLGFITVPVTIFWVVLVINAVNLIDGMDGLATGIIFISAATISVLSYKFGEVEMLAPFLILAGSTLGFLRHNFPPARVFLGDTGSMFLGLMMASLSLLSNRKGTVIATLLLPIILMTVPLVDTVIAFFRRFFGRVSPFQKDTRHLHHRLLALGLSQKKVALFFYLICVYLSLTAVVLSLMPKQYAFLVLLILAVGILIAIESLNFVEKRLKEEGRGEGKMNIER